MTHWGHHSEIEVEMASVAVGSERTTVVSEIVNPMEAGKRDSGGSDASPEVQAPFDKFWGETTGGSVDGNDEESGVTFMKAREEVQFEIDAFELEEQPH